MSEENTPKLQGRIAYEQIKSKILHMELLPGAHISEEALSRELHISRTPIRDGLRMLEADGLVVIQKNKGAFVADYSQEEIKNIGTIRLAQDILSAQLAIYYGNEADFARLNQLADRCEDSAASGNKFGRIQTDLDFHLAITQISGNQILVQQQYAIYQRILLVQVSKYTNVADSLAQIHHHRPMIAAIRNRDAAAAVSLICQHVQDFYMIDPHILNYYRGTALS